MYQFLRRMKLPTRHRRVDHLLSRKEPATVQNKWESQLNFHAGTSTLSNLGLGLTSFVSQNNSIMDNIGQYLAAAERTIVWQNIGGLLADMYFWQDVDASTLFGFVIILSTLKDMCHQSRVIFVVNKHGEVSIPIYFDSHLSRAVARLPNQFSS